MAIRAEIEKTIRSSGTQLPTLPVVVNNILTIAKDEGSSAKELADVIVKDLAISSKLLRLANSAYYGLMKKVDTISRAITIIGFNEVIGITIGMNVFSVFDKRDTNGIMDIKELWLHSITCVTAAKEVAKICHPDIANKIFMAGLLHDMGKVIFAKYFRNEFRDVVNDSQKTKTPLYLKEKEVLGIDHAMLTGLLMKRWKFPDSLLLPCRYHHNTTVCPPDYQHYAMTIALADHISQRAKIGHSGNAVLPEIEKVCKIMGISDGKLELINENLIEQRPKIEEFLQLMT